MGKRAKIWAAWISKLSSPETAIFCTFYQVFAVKLYFEDEEEEGFNFLGKMMKSIAVFAVLAVAAASPFAPKFSGFESHSTSGTITLFAKPETKTADMATILSKDKEAGFHKINGGSELFSSSPLTAEGYTDVRPGHHGFVFRNSQANKEVYCQREAGADDRGTEVTEGAQKAHKFEFHCAEYKDAGATGMRFKRWYGWGGWGNGWGGWGGWGGGYYNGWGGYGGYGGSPWYGGYGGYGKLLLVQYCASSASFVESARPGGQNECEKKGG